VGYGTFFLCVIHKEGLSPICGFVQISTKFHIFRRFRFRQGHSFSFRQVLEKGQVKSIRNRRVYVRSLMKVEEASGVCKDRS
jgi:hypothetical protein